ncbi:S8 family serine peptidase [Tautonia sociabilis]|uniref:Peptidase S8/S53 domain-containing protein n=1 Tax=Tautonia sociabilis TaxID=2080755 RepID=A0A432MMA8_9BACT|nr:S8 family serine peptidase [Tautonia sociabilis]RUL88389.1 hypothetical protein TsocGM_07650 [Tautonia sociabilis]
MGSFKGDKRKAGRDRRRPIGRLAGADRGPEALEQRALLASMINTPPAVTAAAIDGPVFAKGGKHLAELYEASRVGGNALQQTLDAKRQFITFRGDRVGIDLYADASLPFDRVVKSLTDLGMQVIATDANYRIVEGFLPISQLRTATELAGTRNIDPIYTPVIDQQGIANNQGDQVLRADVARSTFNVDGSGVIVGVLSDSVDRFQGGLADSIASGDLPARSRINVLQDEPVGGSNTDEGRAMLELIHDIAPGADLAFQTVFIGGPVQYADAVRNIVRAGGADVVVDDVRIAQNPVFQEGLIGQAVVDVTTNDNAVYLSAAGNSGQGGIETNFRGVSASVTGIGTGRFLDFDPGPGVATTLPVTVNSAGLVLLHWDDPWYNGQADTNLDFFLLDGNNQIVTQGINNNIGSATPQEVEVVAAPGNYQLAIRVTAGPDPGRVRFMQFSADIAPSQQFGNAGGTTYATTFGHKTSPNTIGVGAVFYNDAPPFSTTTPIPSESFSAAGPVFYLFDPQGNRLSSPQLLLKPDVSGPDGVNTSFFGSPDIPQDPDTLPNFFGTSAASPNVAAVVALMRQLNPNVSYNVIQDALKRTAVGLNGTPGGSYDPIGGHGLVDAVAALNAVDQLRVVASNPADVATLGQAPTFIELTFSKPVDPTTLQASDLTFPVLPNGVTVSVGAPQVVNALTIRFPVEFTAPAGVSANGTYAFNLADGAITATDGSNLIGLTRAFILADQAAPRVQNTIFQGRIIVVQFSEAMRGSTITKENLMLVRTGWTGSFGRPENVVVTDDPRAVLFYDAANNRAIFDLRALPQSAMPSDIYALVVSDAVTDVAGNRLDGEFNGRFPSGNGQTGGSFAQELPRLVEAPQVANFSLTAASDTGLPGDRGTNQNRPTFSGFAVASFPSTNVGLQVAIQFFQAHTSGFDLQVGPNGQGYVGNPDLIVNTDENGFFSFQPPFDLRDGLHRVRIVVVGESENPPLPGKATQAELSFVVDSQAPLVTASSIPNESRISNLRSITLNIADPVSPADPTDPLAIPVQLDRPALDPDTATNLGNYSLINLGPDRVLGTADDADLSRFIENATFVSTTQRNQSSDPYTGRVELSFSDGLPSGRYVLVARTQEAAFSGIRDAAGNPLDNNPAQPGNQSFATFFELQPEATFITSYTAFSPSVFSPGTMAASGPRAYYEIPVPGFTPRAEAPPEVFQIDFSNTLAPRDYSNAVQLIRSANSPGSPSDGDFGLGAGGFTQVSGVTVELVNSVPGATLGQPGYLNRLVVRIPEGQTLPPDYYRLVIPNTGSEQITDIFGNVADLEFLGNERPDGDGFEVFMPDGTYRDGLTGDAVEGGSFVTGFVVVPGQRRENPADPNSRILGNIIYARPDYQDDPFLTTDDPDGSVLKPFPTLLPEAVPNLNNNGDLNSSANFGTGFNPIYDRNANNRFDRSAFFEATRVRDQGPVVIVALPGILRPVPGTTDTTQQTFVIAPPAGADPSRPENNASGSVPAQTTLVFDQGSALKLFNASLFVQNQGSALQLRGGSNPDEQVIFTSLLDDSVGGDTNNDAQDTTPGGGNWGGIIFRNYDDVSAGRDQLPGSFPIDGKLGLSGASDVMSIIDHALLRFGGGAVPQTIGTRYDTITLFNSRPAITNTTVADGAAGGGAAGGTQAAISADLDSLREDEIARGPLIRRTQLLNNSINGILIRPPVGSLQAQETDAIFYPANPTSQGGGKNFTIDDPLPYVLNSQLVLGQRLLTNTGGQTDQTVSSRLYVQPGMMVKSSFGASLATVNTSSSVNFGERTYIRQFDANPNISPADPNFVPNSIGDAKPLFTSLFDDAAETYYLDQATGTRRVIVPAGPTDNNSSNPAPAPGNVPSSLRWGSISILPGSIAAIDETEFRYGGGQIITPLTALPNRQVLDLTNDIASFLGYNAAAAGANVSITNNDFFDNFDTPIVVEPNQLLAADPTRPLLSGNPFFRGNVMERNSVNGLGIKTTPGVIIPPPNNQGDFYTEAALDDGANLTVNSVWDDTDIVHVLRGTVNLAGWSGFGNNDKPVPDPTSPEADANGFLPELQPFITLTIQSALPDTLLADGTRIARPGESMYVKLFTDTFVGNPGPGTPIDPALNQVAADNANIFGAGFNVGFDDGIDPPGPSPLIDPGYGSQLRIVGIGTNETTGQQRVPVVITSLRDNTVGPVVRGVDQSNSFFSSFNPSNAGINFDTPAPGDGGVIAFGGGSLFDYNLFDPRNGSIIDNADIRYLHRIEFQGGSIVDAFDSNASNAIDIGDNLQFQKLGLTPQLQYNAQLGWTVSNSSLDSFRDAGIFADQGFDLLARTLIGTTTPVAGGTARIGGLRGQPTNLFLVNNTISNMPVGVRVNYGANVANANADQNPAQIVLLHNTFYNNGVGFRTQAPAWNPNPNNSLSHVYFLAMNNIFDGGTIGSDPAAAAVRLEGMVATSQLLFNVFNNYSTVLDDQISQIAGAPFLGNNSPIFGDPKFLDPANGNFFLQSGSAAIDAALSEFGPTPIGDMLYPVSNQVLDPRGGIRNTIGRTNPFGGVTIFQQDPREIVTLPGTPNRGFVDQFIPVLAGSAGSSFGPASNIATYGFAPLTGERDKEGFLRLDDPSTPNIGFGSRPFFDIGAREFRTFDPPQITTQGAPDLNGDGIGDGVFASIADPATGQLQMVSLYTPGQVAGSNRVPQEIFFQFDERVDPQTINAQTVLLQASGGDGIFGNANNPGDRTIPLSGRLAFDPDTRRLSIKLGAGNLLLSNDLYRIVLVGSGGNVIRDPQGNALDGENLGPNGLPLALPSGDGFPGGNFILPFTIDTRAPSIVPGSFGLASPSDPTLQITNGNPPTFSGNVTDLFPPVNPLIGQQVTLDLDLDGDGVFERLGVGTATTDATGNFTITPTQALSPDSPFNVGPDGQLGTADDTGYSRARVRITDVSGNASDPNDPNATVRFILDTRSPRIISSDPATGSRVSNGGRFRVSFTADENLSLASLMAQGAITVTGAGLDGVFNTQDDNAASIDLSSLNVEFLATSPSGPSRISFDVTGATADDIYRITVANTVTDRAGNAIVGNSTGGYTIDVVVYAATQRRTIFVGPGGTGTPTGSRANPYPTIAAGLAVASIGDTVAVLPGTYNESVTLKSLVRLVSAAPSSTDSNVVPGTPQSTIIRAPLDPNAPEVTVQGIDLLGFTDGGELDTEFRGFAVVAPLTNLVSGAIDPSSIGIRLVNSGGRYHGNVVINAGEGISVEPKSGAASNARIDSNVLAGNRTGIVVRDPNNTIAIDQPVQIVNNTIALNNGGIILYDAAINEGSPVIADVVNNIFWQNSDRAGGADTPIGIFPAVAVVRNNMFSSNPNTPLVGFNTAALGSTPNADAAYNYIGDPAFAAPRDPRPQFDGPTITLLDGNFGLTANSDAIDTADSLTAPALDFLNLGRVDIPNRGFPPFGPADMGAIEFRGSAGSGGGGIFIPPTGSTPPDDNLLFGQPSGQPNSTFQPGTGTGTGVGSAAQTAGVQPTAGKARRDREALRARLAGRQEQVNQVAPQGKRAWQDLLSRGRFRRGQ